MYFKRHSPGGCVCCGAGTIASPFSNTLYYIGRNYSGSIDLGLLSPTTSRVAVGFDIDNNYHILNGPGLPRINWNNTQTYSPLFPVGSDADIAFNAPFVFVSTKQEGLHYNQKWNCGTSLYADSYPMPVNPGDDFTDEFKIQLYDSSGSKTREYTLLVEGEQVSGPLRFSKRLTNTPHYTSDSSGNLYYCISIQLQNTLTSEFYIFKNKSITIKNGLSEPSAITVRDYLRSESFFWYEQRLSTPTFSPLKDSFYYDETDFYKGTSLSGYKTEDEFGRIVGSNSLENLDELKQFLPFEDSNGINYNLYYWRLGRSLPYYYPENKIITCQNFAFFNANPTPDRGVILDPYANDSNWWTQSKHPWICLSPKAFNEINDVFTS